MSAPTHARVLLLAAGLALMSPRPAHAWVGALLKAASGAAKVSKTAAKGAGAAGKAGKGAVVAGKAAKVGTVGLAADALVNGGRGMRALASLPDELGSAAGYVAKSGDELVILDRAGARAAVPDGDLLRAADDLEARSAAGLADEGRVAEIETVDLIIDPLVAADDPSLAAAEHIRYHVPDANGTLHRVSQDSSGSWIVDVAGGAMDLADFGNAAVEAMLDDYEELPELELEAASTAGSPDETPPFMMLVYGIVILGVGAFSWREYRKPSRRIKLDD